LELWHFLLFLDSSSAEVYSGRYRPNIMRKEALGIGYMKIVCTSFNLGLFNVFSFVKPVFGKFNIPI
jgi:hypothetical protein